MANPTHYLLMFAGVPGRFTPSPEAVATADLAYHDLELRVKAFTTDDLAHHLWATLHGYTMLQLAGPRAEPDVARVRFERGVELLLG
jgi:hypothetical protein